MLLLFIYRNISTSRFSGLYLVFILVLFPCARAGLSSPLLIEAGVDDLFPRWNPHSFALITLAVYAHSHDILSPEPAHLAGPSAHTRSRLTTINFTHPPHFSSLCSKPSQSLIWTLISMLYNFSRHCCIRAPPPRTQCFLSSSCRRFCCLLTYITNAPPCNSCTLKDKTKSVVTIRNDPIKGTEGCHLGLTFLLIINLLGWNAQHPGTVILPLRLVGTTSDVIGSVTVS